MTLDDKLIKYFGRGFSNIEDTDCKSYNKLVELLYAVGTIVERDMSEIVGILDSITMLNE